MGMGVWGKMERGWAYGANRPGGYYDRQRKADADQSYERNYANQNSPLALANLANKHETAREERRFGRLQTLMQSMGLGGTGAGGSGEDVAATETAAREASTAAEGATRAGGRESGAAMKRNLVRSGLNTADPAQALMAETAEAGATAQVEQGIMQERADLEERLLNRRLAYKQMDMARQQSTLAALLSYAA